MSHDATFIHCNAKTHPCHTMQHTSMSTFQHNPSPAIALPLFFKRKLTESYMKSLWKPMPTPCLQRLLCSFAIAPLCFPDEIDRIVHEATMEANAYPSPYNYFNFPKSVCTSVNEVREKLRQLDANRGVQGKLVMMYAASFLTMHNEDTTVGHGPLLRGLPFLTMHVTDWEEQMLFILGSCHPLHRVFSKL
eukprot:1142477-Pelagomonas_calceolata.AAC.2